MNESIPFNDPVTNKNSNDNNKNRDSRRIAIGAGLALGAAVTAGAVMLANQGSEHAPSNEKATIMEHLTDRHVGDKLTVIDSVVNSNGNAIIQTAPWKGAETLTIAGPVSIDHPELVTTEGDDYLCFAAGGKASNIGCIELTNENISDLTLGNTERTKFELKESTLNVYTVDNVDEGLAFAGAPRRVALAQLQTMDVVLSDQTPQMDVVLPEQTPAS